MIKNASNLYPFALQDQLSNGLTGQTPSVFLRQDNGSFAAASGSVTEVDSTNYPGLYQITLTATECNCDVLTIAVSLPDGQEPAILDVVYPVTTGGATPQQIWEYAGGRTVTNTIPTAQNIWEYSSRTLTASALTAQQVWEYSGGRTLTASPTDISGLATSSDLSAVATNVSAIKAKTDNLPASPAAVGSEMALTSAAISAVQNGLSTFNPANDTVTLNATEDGTLTAIKTKVDTLTNTDLTGIATSTDVSNAQTAIISRGNEAWATATGFTVPADLSGLSTFNSATDTVTINSTQAAGMATATGFATPSDIPSASDNASAVWSANSRTLTESALTAADVWSYSSRTITDSPDIQAELTTYGAAKTSDIPTSEDIWEYTDRTLTEEISVEISSENIEDITESVWEAPDRTLTDMTPKPNQKSIVCTPSNVINAYGIPRLENWTNETAGTQAFDDKINTYITLAKEKMATDLNDQINAAIAYIGADNISELCAWLTGYNLYSDDESTDTDSLPETRYNQYLEQIHRIMENI